MKTQRRTVDKTADNQDANLHKHETFFVRTKLIGCVVSEHVYVKQIRIHLVPIWCRSKIIEPISIQSNVDLYGKCV